MICLVNQSHVQSHTNNKLILPHIPLPLLSKIDYKETCYFIGEDSDYHNLFRNSSKNINVDKIVTLKRGVLKSANVTAHEQEHDL